MRFLQANGLHPRLDSSHHPGRWHTPIPVHPNSAIKEHTYICVHVNSYSTNVRRPLHGVMSVGKKTRRRRAIPIWDFTGRCQTTPIHRSFNKLRRFLPITLARACATATAPPSRPHTVRSSAPRGQSLEGPCAVVSAAPSYAQRTRQFEGLGGRRATRVGLQHCGGGPGA